MTREEEFMNDDRTIALAFKFAKAVYDEEDNNIVTAAIIRLLGSFAAEINGDQRQAALMIAAIANNAIVYARICLESEREGSTFQ